MLKPLLRTIILASILFFLLVYMGMKYHWVDAFKKEETQVKQNISEIAPAMPKPEVINDLVTDFVADSENKSNDDFFLPKILKNTAATSLIDAMTKDQIALHCETLYYKSLSMTDDPNADILIGNCVVSNYQEPFQKTIKTTQMLLQEQQLKLQAIKYCRQDAQILANSDFSNIEKELFIGVCVANYINNPPN